MHAAREIEPGKAKRLRLFVGAGARQLAGVVAAAAIRIHQRLVGVEHLAKARRRLAVARIDVRMQPPGKTLVRSLDVSSGSAAIDA